MTIPRRIAVIDVGSNSVRLLIARELSPSAFEVVDEERFDARLGEGQAGGDITPEGFQRGLRALRVMAQLARSAEPAAITVVGTEALRSAPNAGAFLEEAERQTGLPIRVLSGAEEAFAAFLGVANSIALDSGYVLDIGGGSLELMRVENRALVDVQSAPLGAIYATERYLKGDPPTAREVRALRKAVRQQFTVAGPVAGLYGTGGAIRNLARIIRLRQRYPLRRLHGYVLSAREIHRLAATLAGATADARRRMPGVNAGRADILPAAVIVVDELMLRMGAVTITVAGQGLREGLVWQEIRGDGPVLGDVRGASVAGLLRANGMDVAATEAVAAAAAGLFEATVPLHSLGPADLGLLTTAARLAGIGMHIDFYNRDRHAEYLVHSGDLHGFTHREIVLLGALVRWAGAGAGTPDLSFYSNVVDPDDTSRVTILAALLGVVRAVYRRSPSPVAGFEARLESNYLRLRLAGAGQLEPEVLELERQQRRLEGLLRVSMSVTVIAQA